MVSHWVTCPAATKASVAHVDRRQARAARAVSSVLRWAFTASVKAAPPQAHRPRGPRRAALVTQRRGAHGSSILVVLVAVPRG
ncbi:MAG: hypothetical protein IPF99_27135 [Deltaproteobacteria bacterium]|nr:hypothetical protein [Deltaproteobacteria bacterium]